MPRGPRTDRSCGRQGELLAAAVVPAEVPPGQRVLLARSAKWQNDLEHFPLPDVLILSADVDSPELAARLSGYNGQILESLRPGSFVQVYVRDALWPKFIDSGERSADLPTRGR